MEILQIIWAETNEVGCGIAQCGGLKKSPLKPTDLVYFVACLFGPAQSSNLNELPFLAGPACTACADGGACDDGLCSGNIGLAKLLSIFGLLHF